ncbi:hypothetical protein M885DRAFT_503443 [Pelagophyceae sp. CCMP2097]|nr:hypothetical protein M885DRAFT_503443 [Pelagophyceae sp. CCMP2097]
MQGVASTGVPRFPTRHRRFRCGPPSRRTRRILNCVSATWPGSHTVLPMVQRLSSRLRFRDLNWGRRLEKGPSSRHWVAASCRKGTGPGGPARRRSRARLFPRRMALFSNPMWGFCGPSGRRGRLGAFFGAASRGVVVSVGATLGAVRRVSKYGAFRRKVHKGWSFRGGCLGAFRGILFGAFYGRATAHKGPRFPDPWRKGPSATAATKRSQERKRPGAWALDRAETGLQRAFPKRARSSTALSETGPSEDGPFRNGPGLQRAFPKRARSSTAPFRIGPRCDVAERLAPKRVSATAPPTTVRSLLDGFRGGFLQRAF